MVDPLVGLEDEPGLLPKCSDDTGTLHRFIEVGVDGRAAHGFQSPQLAGCGHIETLQHSGKNEQALVNLRYQ